MTSKPTLLLHIGTHKTGTSTLQRLMEDHRADLERQGFCYPLTSRPPNAHLKIHTSFVYGLTHGTDALMAERQALMTEFAKSGCHTMVISAEGLSTPRVIADNHLAGLQTLAHDFDIRVVCVLRRQDYFIESLWNQYAKVNKTDKHIDAFITEPDSVQHMTYLATLDTWSRHATVQALGFETSLEAGLVESFSALTGIALPVDDKARNVSPSMSCAAVMAAMTRQQMVGDWRKINRRIGPDGPRYALGSRLRAELLARFADHNAKLQHEYGVTFPQTMPEEPADPIAVPTAQELTRFSDTVVTSTKPNSSRRNPNRPKRRNRAT